MSRLGEQRLQFVPVVEDVGVKAEEVEGDFFVVGTFFVVVLEVLFKLS